MELYRVNGYDPPRRQSARRGPEYRARGALRSGIEGTHRASQEPGPLLTLGTSSGSKLLRNRDETNAVDSAVPAATKQRNVFTEKFSVKTLLRTSPVH